MSEDHTGPLPGTFSLLNIHPVFLLGLIIFTTQLCLYYFQPCIINNNNINNSLDIYYIAKYVPAPFQGIILRNILQQLDKADIIGSMYLHVIWLNSYK
jgi:hypothetical protein